MDLIFLNQSNAGDADLSLKLADTPIAAGVLGRLDESGPRWLIVPLDKPVETSKQRGYFFAGTLACLPSGRYVAAAENDDPNSAAILAAAFPEFCEIARANKDRDWLKFMRSLWN